ncbi:MAG: tRNA-specific 2-thiouridylase MnmA [Patescibacteria group bacterium]|nr:MAG: tRNA-specific 2-thiouridylase MnmA [Patescibacteria group bacterium]
MKKVALGMSGGVDSSVCAHLLLEQGYAVTGVYLECWRAPGCRSEEDRKDALKVALDLGIPFKVLDFKQEYRDKVVEYFFTEYEAGRTPNPDVMCNKEIKFGMFYDWAMKEGFDFVATGHYAKISENETEDGTTIKQLAIPKDAHKDQTYFLYLLNEGQIDHTLFPLQNMLKSEVRTEAEKRKLHVSNKKDSVGICFIGDINVHNFLKERLGENPGAVVDTAGNVIGTHKGLWFYTVGQRNGFQINAKTVIKMDDGTTIDKHNIPPFYVIRKNPEKNQLVVGFGHETLTDTFDVRDMHWIVNNNDKLALNSTNLFVRIRHTGDLLKCKIKVKDDIKTASTVTLTKPTKGIAQGQSAVFYKKINDEFICLGGGVIS